MAAARKTLSPPPVDCELLFDILRGYEQYRLLTSAVRLGVFSRLREPTEAQDLADSLRIDPVLTEKFLNCLAAIGLTEKKGRAYVNSALSATYLVPEGPFSVMNLVRLIGAGEKLWDQVPTALEGRLPAKSERRNLQDVFDQSFVVAMAEGAMRGGLQATMDALTRRPEFKQAQRLLDFGGGHGLYAIGFALANPALEVTVFDLPRVVGVARQYVEDYELQGRIKLIGGNFTKDTIGGGYDVVFASDALYRPAETLRAVLARIRDSLVDGGLFVTKHWAMNTDRAGPLTTVLWEFRLALGAYGHYVYDNDEYMELLRRAGFDSLELIDISTKAKPSSLILAKKPLGG